MPVYAITDCLIGKIFTHPANGFAVIGFHYSGEYVKLAGFYPIEFFV
jgi:hypothetical protein